MVALSEAVRRVCVKPGRWPAEVRLDSGLVMSGGPRCGDLVVVVAPESFATTAGLSGNDAGRLEDDDDDVKGVGFVGRSAVSKVEARIIEGLW